MNYARFFGVGFTFIVILGALAAAGYLLDRVLDTLPLLLLTGLVAGFIGGMYYIYLILKRMSGG